MRLLTLAAIALLAAPAAARAAPNAAELFKKKCSMCHGDDGRAQTRMGRKYSMPDFTSADWQASRPDEELRATVVNGGKTKMPAWKDRLSNEEIDALVGSVRAFAKPKP